MSTVHETDVDVVGTVPSAVRAAVLVTATEPEPRSFGKQVVLGGMLDHLVERLGADAVHVVVLGRAPESVQPTRYQVHRIDPPRVGEQVRSLLGRCLLGPHTSLQETALYSRRIADRLQDLLAEIGADVEVWDTLRTGQYAESVRSSGSRVLYADDLFSRRYESLLAVPGGIDAAASPLGEFTRFIPGPMRRIVSGPRVYRPLMRLERRLLMRREIQVPTFFSRTLLVSDAEVRELADRVPQVEVSLLPPAIPGRETVERAWPGTPDFVFLGSLDFAPNRDGLDWFLRNCRDEVLRQVPDFSLTVVGRGNEQGLDSAEAWGRRVSFRGFVPDLGAVLGSHAALLSVLRFGSGTKIKVVEALSFGLPVVATSAGAHGIPPAAADGILVGDDPETLAAALAAAAEPTRNATLAAAARRGWETTYSRAAVAAVYDEVFGTTASTGGIR